MATGNKEIVRRALEDSWQDPGVFDELISSDYVGYDPALPEPIRGPQGAKNNFKQYSDAFEGAHITVKDQIAEGDAVATRWEGRGRHTGELMGAPLPHGTRRAAPPEPRGRPRPRRGENA